MQITRANIWYLLTHKSFLVVLLIINLLGTIYGYYWYGWQLAITKPIFIFLCQIAQLPAYSFALS